MKKYDLTMTSSIVPEDLRYLASTQYRLWSFTPTDLQALRTTTNQFAADRVREAVRRDREAPEGEVDYLTVEEERKLITFFCRQTIQLADHLKLPTDVKASLLFFNVLLVCILE
jgi:cyclin H